MKRSFKILKLSAFREVGSFKFETSHFPGSGKCFKKVSFLLRKLTFLVLEIKYLLKIIHLAPLTKSHGNCFPEVYRKRKRPPLTVTVPYQKWIIIVFVQNER